MRAVLFFLKIVAKASVSRGFEELAEGLAGLNQSMRRATFALCVLILRIFGLTPAIARV
jgi:hypothetical protein